MHKPLMLDIPFVEALHVGKKQKPKSILIRLSETTSESGAALGIANSWNRTARVIDSCHYVIDETNSYQCVRDNVAAFSTASNSQNTISINVCAQPVMFSEIWNEPPYSEVLIQTAKLVSELSSKYRIPIREVELNQQSLWFKKGIIFCIKGSWPKSHFIDTVNFFKTQGGV